jgi:sugar lactone lactonase YvrE
LNGPAGVTPYYDAGQQKLFIYIADKANNRIRKLDTVSQTVVTVAGTGSSGSTGDNEQATAATLNLPEDVSVDTSGNIYIADTSNNKIRKVTAATGIITTVAGTGVNGVFGDGGLATLAKLNLPQGVFIDSGGNIYIADQSSRIRKVTAATGIINTVAGTGIALFSGDGDLATKAKIKMPQSIFVDSGGNIYFADTGNNRIRKVTAATGIINTVAGSTAGYAGDGGSATAANLNAPKGVSVDAAGNIYIADTGNHCLRLVNIHDGNISTMAGTGTGGYDGDLQPAVQARLSSPARVALGLNKGAGRIYISDTGNNRIRVLFLKKVKEVYGP